jgi:hypothetical protein
MFFMYFGKRQALTVSSGKFCKKKKNPRCPPTVYEFQNQQRPPNRPKPKHATERGQAAKAKPLFRFPLPGSDSSVGFDLLASVSGGAMASSSSSSSRFE